MQLDSIPTDSIRGVFTDLDDTLTDDSKLHPEVYQALWDLKQKDYWLAIVSGRPAGWADCLMRLWPLDAMVFENGAGIITRQGKKLKVTNLAHTQNLDEQHQTLQKIFDEIKQEIPHLKLASDQPYRLFDFAIDFVEEPPVLTQEEIQLALEKLKAHKEITAKLSSIHINYWVGKHTKVTSCEWLIKEEGKKRGISKEQIVFSGDSPNDEPLFEYFDHTVGVANIQPFLKGMKHQPKVVTSERGGKGFCQLTAVLQGK